MYNELFGQTIYSGDVVVLASFAFPAHPLVRILLDVGRVHLRSEQGRSEFGRNIKTRARNHSRVRRTFGVEDDEMRFFKSILSLSKETIRSRRWLLLTSFS